MERVSLQMGTKVYLDEYNDLHTISSAMGTVKHLRCSPEVVTLLQHVDTPQTARHLYTILHSYYPLLCFDEFMTLLSRLAEEGIIRLNDLPPELAHSSFALFLEELAPAQAEHIVHTLQTSTAIVIGVGTIGAAVATQLAQCRVGQLILIDPDHVEEGNLERQFTYTRNDIGVHKALALQNFLQRRTPTQIVPVLKKIESSADLKSILQRLETLAVIVNCADSPSVDYVAGCIAEAVHCTTPIPFIAGGGYSGHLGSVGPTFIPGQSICWLCYQQQTQNARQIQDMSQWQLIASRPFTSTSTHPAFGPLGIFISSLMASEAIWILTGLKEPLFLNRHGEWDLSQGAMIWREVKASTTCPQCQSLI